MTDMIELAVYNRDGKEIESLQVDEKAFGGRVRYPLLKQAIVMYHANKRIGTAATKSRGMVEGSTRKLYRQKGTGNARMGSVRTNLRKGGGVAFGKYARDFGKQMPRKQRQLARNSAILAKFKSLNVVVVDELSFASPKTKDFATVLRNLKIDRSCLVTIPQLDMNVYKSARNIPRIQVLPLAELNAGDICNRAKVLFTKAALLSLINEGSKSSQ
jgi:large subunit ribosomal protein L4